MEKIVQQIVINKELVMTDKIKLGMLIRDRVSGFKGIAVSRHYYLAGCTRITIQPKIDKEGKLPPVETFDELNLEIIEQSKINHPEEAYNTGGPEKWSDNRKY